MTQHHPILAVHVLDEFDPQVVDHADMVFARLGAYLDDEAESLERLARLLDLPALPGLLRRLHGLHRGATDLPDAAALADAKAILDALVEALRTISPSAGDGAARATSAAPVSRRRTAAPATPRDLDAAVRWAGARAEDQLRAVARLRV